MTSRALVVDDNRVNRMLLGRALEELGVGSVEAENGCGRWKSWPRRRSTSCCSICSCPCSTATRRSSACPRTTGSATSP
ncbi:MAG TPA: response regulator [Gaiellaceae bacterium]|nr:response regulator [Gaiellaceae bacterium]